MYTDVHEQVESEDAAKESLRSRRSFILCRLCLLLALLLLGACRSEPPAPEVAAVPTDEQTPTHTPAPTDTPTPTETPSPTATATLTPTPAPLDPSAIFDLISPSVAFVETGHASGSGILVEGNYLLTNAHVVWPYEEARVVFGGGVEFENVPVHNWDLMADIALLGPLEQEAVAEIRGEPLALVDGEDLIVGAPVYLVGYPGEVEEFPEPTITGGIISRHREWEEVGITFLQTDAKIAGGQSGGALVSEMGDVIGLSGFAFSEALFGLVASARDLRPRVELLAAGEDASGMSARTLDRTRAVSTHSLRLPSFRDAVSFMIEEPIDGMEIRANSSQDVALRVVDLHGQEVAFADETATGEEVLTLDDPGENPLVLHIWQFGVQAAFANLYSDGPLLPFEDDDDERSLFVGEPIAGSLDVPGDVDFYHLRLDQGDIVNLRIDSPNIDPLLTVSYEGAGPEQELWDDDSGGGLAGANAELTYRAPHDGLYIVVVEDAMGQQWGGYTISATGENELAAGAPTPMAPAPTPIPIVSPSGHPMLPQEGANGDVRLLAPSWWVNTSDSTNCEARLCLIAEDGLLEVYVDNSGTITSRSEMANGWAYVVPQIFPGAVRQGWRTMQTEAGETVEVLHHTVAGDEGTIHVTSMIAFNDGVISIVFYIIFGDEVYEDLEPMMEHSFRTFAWVE